jgi:hypothetical protein
MGCDMHSILQYKGKTVAVDFHRNRNYRLFGILAGVRGSSGSELPGEPLDVFPVSIGDVTLKATEDLGGQTDVTAEFGTDVRLLVGKDSKLWLGYHNHRTMSLYDLAGVKLNLTASLVMLGFVELIKETLLNELDEEDTEELSEYIDLEDFIGANGEDINVIIGFDS